MWFWLFILIYILLLTIILHSYMHQNLFYARHYLQNISLCDPLTIKFHQNRMMISDVMRKLVGIDWSQISSPLYIYAHCFSLIGDNFVSGCSRYVVQPFVLEALMSSIERYPSWTITILRGYLPTRGEWDPYKNRNFI